MPLYKPSELLDFLSSRGVFAKRGLSQNFLVDGNIVRKITERLPEDLPILEIGPGPGVLTEALLAQGRSVVAVEKDDLFARELSRLDPTSTKLTVVHNEIQRFEPLFEIVVVGNIPYGITTDIFDWIWRWRARIRGVRLMVQEEVADKVALIDGCSTRNLYTLLLNYLGKVKKLFSVPPTAFIPIPHIGSAVIEIQMRNHPLTIAQEETLFLLAKEAFQHKRKQLTSSLKGSVTQEILQKASLRKEARPEELSVKNWEVLVQAL